MSRTTLGLTIAAGAMAAGCGGTGFPAPHVTSELEGTWRACVTVNGIDARKTLMIDSMLNVSTATVTFITTNGTCSTYATSAVGVQTTFLLGTEVTATLGMATVRARQLTITGPSPVYTLVYVNTGTTPTLLYLGDLSATPGLDGTAPAKRPEVLDAAWAYVKQ